MLSLLRGFAHHTAARYAALRVALSVPADVTPDVPVRPARDVLTAEKDGIAVLLDLNHAIYVGLDEVGTTAWRAIETGATPRAVAAAVSAEFDVPDDVALADISRFITDLHHRRLVVRA